MPREMTFTGPTRTSARWLADPITTRTLMPPGGRLDATQFLASDGAKITVTASAAQGAVAIAVSALPNLIPAGTPLDFGGAKLAITTALAAAGATSIAVRALPTALAGAETATYKGIGKKYIEGGTPVSRTLTERDALAGFGPAVATDEEFYLTMYDVGNLDHDDFVELVRPGAVIKENYLPGWATMAADVKAKVRATYRCILGSTGV